MPEAIGQRKEELRCIGESVQSTFARIALHFASVSSSIDQTERTREHLTKLLAQLDAKQLGQLAVAADLIQVQGDASPLAALHRIESLLGELAGKPASRSGGFPLGALGPDYGVLSRGPYEVRATARVELPVSPSDLSAYFKPHRIRLSVEGVGVEPHEMALEMAAVRTVNQIVGEMRFSDLSQWTEINWDAFSHQGLARTLSLRVRNDSLFHSAVVFVHLEGRAGDSLHELETARAPSLVGLLNVDGTDPRDVRRLRGGQRQWAQTNPAQRHWTAPASSAVGDQDDG